MESQSASLDVDRYLYFDADAETARICSMIRSEVKRRGVRGVVIGLSGGLDSTTCAFLCARCIPMDCIHLISLPERDSSLETRSRGQAAARMLGLPLEEKNVSELFQLSGFYKGVPAEVAGNRLMLERAIQFLRWLSASPALYPWAQQYAFSERHGVLAWLLRHWLWSYAGRSESFIFGKVRARMLLLSTLAMQRDCLLICTTDRSEWSIGFYDPHGDGVGDIAPLRHLYKTQIRELAMSLGVPEEIVRQPSSGDLAAGLPNETAMGLSYEKLDRVLAGLNLGLGDEKIAMQAGVKRTVVKAIRAACSLADERRRMPVGVEKA